jgi:hypothetical protein
LDLAPHMLVFWPCKALGEVTSAMEFQLPRAQATTGQLAHRGMCLFWTRLPLWHPDGQCLHALLHLQHRWSRTALLGAEVKSTKQIWINSLGSWLPYLAANAARRVAERYAGASFKLVIHLLTKVRDCKHICQGIAAAV